MTWGAWGSRLYAFVPPNRVGAFIDFLAPRQLDGATEIFMLNQKQYDVIGQNPASGYYMYAGISTPILTTSLSGLLTALSGSLSGTLYFILNAETGLITHTSGGASVGASLTYAQAVTALSLEPAAQLTALQSLSTVYNATPISNPVTAGGNNATHLIVTSLADTGVGTLRDMATRPYARHITFAQGLHGTIQLQSDLSCAANMTLDAGGHGICVAGGHFEVRSETIINNMRFRNGVVNYNAAGYIDCFSVLPNAQNVYLVNCSFTHGADSNLEILGTHVYAYRCLIAQQMSQYNRKGTNVTQGGGYYTQHRCITAFVGDRGPTFFSGFVSNILNCLNSMAQIVHIQPRDSAVNLNLIKTRFEFAAGDNSYHKEILSYRENPSEPNPPAYIAASGQYLSGVVNMDYPSNTQLEMIQTDPIEPSNPDGIMIDVVGTPYASEYVTLASLVSADAALTTALLSEVGARPLDSIDQAILDAVASRTQLSYPSTLTYPDLSLLSYS